MECIPESNGFLNFPLTCKKKWFMVTTEKKPAGKRKKEVEEVIPAYLIYETLDGIPVYYKGYREVLGKTKTFEEIMAYGDLQWYFINLLKDYFQPLLGKEYWVWSGEGGLHTRHNSNPLLDFIIIPKRDFSYKKAKNKYLDKPPLVVIEVDTKADFEALPLPPGDYYMTKTKLLLDFGVKEVVWVFTGVEKVMVAHPNKPWLTVDWKDEIEVMGHRFSIEKIIEESEAASE